MRLLELFDSRDKKKRLSHIKNLIGVALADGTLEKSELDLIFHIGVGGGLSPDELYRIFSRPDSINFYPPESYKERIEQLYDMVLVMMVNGEIDKNEIALCKLTALRLGFKQAIIDSMVHSVIDMIAKGIASEIAIHRLLSLVED